MPDPTPKDKTEPYPICPVCKLRAYRSWPSDETCYTCSYEKVKDSSGYYVDLDRRIATPCSEETSETERNVAQRTYLSAAQYALAAANTREALGEEAAAGVARSLAALFRDLAIVGERTGRIPQGEQLEFDFPEPTHPREAPDGK
jgi:hypothetical protein